MILWKDDHVDLCSDPQARQELERDDGRAVRGGQCRVWQVFDGDDYRDNDNAEYDRLLNVDDDDYDDNDKA